MGVSRSPYGSGEGPLTDLDVQLDHCDGAGEFAGYHAPWRKLTQQKINVVGFVSEPPIMKESTMAFVAMEDSALTPIIEDDGAAMAERMAKFEQRKARKKDQRTQKVSKAGCGR